MQVRYSDRVCFFFFFFFFLQYTGIEMVNILKSTLSIPVQIFSKNPPGVNLLMTSNQLAYDLHYSDISCGVSCINCFLKAGISDKVIKIG